MKKILTHLTGIVLLLTILVAGGCKKFVYYDTSNGNDPVEVSNRVKIYLKVVDDGEEMHLEMYDSNKRDDIVVDNLETYVLAGSKVIWKRTLFNSGIKKIDNVGSKSGDGSIFKPGAQPYLNSKRFKLEVPEGVEEGDEEYYYIKFTDTDGDTATIDPHLKIPLSN
jgi:hypothetical protein